MVDPAILQGRLGAAGRVGRRRFGAQPDLGMIVMGHTHISAQQEMGLGKVYFNPGAWLDGHKYGVVTAGGAELKRFG